MSGSRPRRRRADPRARRVLAAADLEAGAAGHARVGSEHLLLAIVAAGAGRGATWLRARGVDAATLRVAVRRAVDERAGDPGGIARDDLAALGLDDLPMRPAGGPTPATRRRGRGLPWTEEARAVLDRAGEEARCRPGLAPSRRRRVTEDDLLAALATVRGIRARDLLHDLGIAPDRLRAAIRSAGAGA
ncbi:MAG TPA: Clp protease N-terminal domain-containing protein [Egicoccus sp.]|nr:Clp protease N-terminal domain-containing protein [Egicoccus sp.]HSK23294.1 Clp protease N-terminal domain-containing protein [Egicoccus sp.]